MNVIQQLEKIKNTCKVKYPHYQIWPAYYERRYVEFLSIYEKLPKKKVSSILEIGCGIGYYSAFLSLLSDTTVATDLEQEDLSTHSPGLKPTRDFLSQLGIQNVIVQPASAESLPYPDNSFDIVFSSHVLEHIPDKKKAIQEMNRVLKPGGYNICITPASMDRVYAFFNFHVYLLKRIWYHILIKRIKKKTPHTQSKLTSNADLSKSIKKQLKNYPFPPPHGEFPHFFKELFGWKFRDWEILISNNGEFKLVEQSTFQLNPFLPILDLILPRTGVAIHKLTRKVELRVGKIKPFKYLGYSCITITKYKA